MYVKVSLLYLLYSIAQGCCLLHLIKQDCFVEIFSKNSNLDDWDISLPIFRSRTNLKLHMSVTLKMINKVIMHIDLSKAAGPDCIPVVVLKNSESELSYILAGLFNKCLKESCFPDYWKVSSVDPLFQNIGEMSTAKNYHHFSLLYVVNLIYPRLLTGFDLLFFLINLSLMEFQVRYLTGWEVFSRISS